MVYDHGHHAGLSARSSCIDNPTSGPLYQLPRTNAEDVDDICGYSLDLVPILTRLSRLSSQVGSKAAIGIAMLQSLCARRLFLRPRFICSLQLTPHRRIPVALYPRANVYAYCLRLFRIAPPPTVCPNALKGPHRCPESCATNPTLLSYEYHNIVANI